jgi:hypothetical protein
MVLILANMTRIEHTWIVQNIANGDKGILQVVDSGDMVCEGHNICSGDVQPARVTR